MTNKEKAKEIGNIMLELANYSSYNTPDEQRNNIYNVAKQSALEMAQWKDEQFKEEKKELLGLVKMLKVDEHNQTIIEDLVAMLNL